MSTAENQPENESPKATTPAWQIVLLVALVVVGAYLWWRRAGDGQAAAQVDHLPVTRTTLDRRAADSAYIGDEGVAAILSEFIGREVQPSTIDELSSYISNTMVPMLWLRVGIADENPQPVTGKDMADLLSQVIPREQADNADVRCFPEGTPYHVTVPAAVIDRVRESGCQWEWIRKYVYDISAGEASQDAAEPAAEEGAESEDP